MKISIVGPAHPYRGGLAVIMQSMARVFQHRGDEVKIKAAGGIRTLDTALRMIELGVSRIGSTASVSIVEELKHRL